jgi:molecular chaperone DnaK
VPVHEKARAEQFIGEIRQLVQNHSTDIARLRQLTGDLQQVAAGLAAGGSSRTVADGDRNGVHGWRPDGPDDVIDAEFSQR